MELVASCTRVGVVEHAGAVAIELVLTIDQHVGSDCRDAIQLGRQV